MPSEWGGDAAGRRVRRGADFLGIEGRSGTLNSAHPTLKLVDRFRPVYSEGFKLSVGFDSLRRRGACRVDLVFGRHIGTKASTSRKYAFEPKPGLV